MSERNEDSPEVEREQELLAVRNEHNTLIDLSIAAKPGERFMYAKKIEALAIRIFELKTDEKNLKDLQNELSNYGSPEEMREMFGVEDIVTLGSLLEGTFSFVPPEEQISPELRAGIDKLLKDNPWIEDDNPWDTEFEE